MGHLIKTIIAGIVLFSVLSSQTTYKTAADLEQEWRKYTSYQKDELTSFCDFLFDEGHFEILVTSIESTIDKLIDVWSITQG